MKERFIQMLLISLFIFGFFFVSFRLPAMARSGRLGRSAFIAQFLRLLPKPEPSLYRR